MTTAGDDDEPVDLDALLDELDHDNPISPSARQLADGLRTLYERQADEDRSPLFDAAIAAAMEADNSQTEMRRQMRHLGERMGSMYLGLTDAGVDIDDACGLVQVWMECAIFRRVDRETGTLGM